MTYRKKVRGTDDKTIVLPDGGIITEQQGLQPSIDRGVKTAMIKVAIYARVSTKDQNCDRQINDLRSYAERAGMELVEIFKETESGAKCDRQQRKLCIEMARQRKIEAVLVTELSRWGRSTSDLIATLQELMGFHCSLIALSGLQMDMSTPSGKLVATIMSGVSEFERGLIQERVRSGLANARLRGKKLGRPSGLSKKISLLVPHIKKMSDEGMADPAIARELRISKYSV